MMRWYSIVASALCLLVTACRSEKPLVSAVTFDLHGERFADYPATATLEAIGDISQAANGSIIVGFNLASGMEMFVASAVGVSLGGPHRSSLDMMCFGISTEGILINDEVLSVPDAVRQLDKYAEALELTGSRSRSLLTASSGTTNAELAELLSLLAERDFFHILVEPTPKENSKPYSHLRRKIQPAPFSVPEFRMPELQSP